MYIDKTNILISRIKLIAEEILPKESKISFYKIQKTPYITKEKVGLNITIDYKNIRRFLFIPYNEYNTVKDAGIKVTMKIMIQATEKQASEQS